MRNLTQFAVSMVLLASQVHIPGLGGGTAAAQSTTNAAVHYEVNLNIKSGSPVVITASQPDYDSQVLAPIRAAQAKAAAAAKARSTWRYVWTSVILPAGTHADWMREAGIYASDFGFVNYIIGHESGWGVTKSNYGGSGAYGLGQAYPASKMAAFGADYLTDPVTQLRWADAYAKDRYGSWANAYAHWVLYHCW